MTIGVLRETKLPPDRRVPLTPEQIAGLRQRFSNHEFIVQSSDIRAYTDEEYREAGIDVLPDIGHSDVLFSVKEVNIQKLLAGKTYFMFSHTAKMQHYNQPLLKRCSELGITLVDYEYLVKDKVRVVAFGYWAGIVGAYNALLGYGKMNKAYNLKPAWKCRDLDDVKEELNKVKIIDGLKIVLTGEGRVATGAKEILEHCGIDPASSMEFLNEDTKSNIYCQIGPQHYTRHRGGIEFRFDDFVENPQNYNSDFFRYARTADMFIACHFWDNRSPVFLTRDQMMQPEFTVRFIADISCDVNGPIPSTIRASSIESPFYGYDAFTGKEISPFSDNHLTVMAVDNLPGELPRDASADFGEKLSKLVLPELLSRNETGLIERATILKDGKLTENFKYLSDYLKGN